MASVPTAHAPLRHHLLLRWASGYQSVTEIFGAQAIAVESLGGALAQTLGSAPTRFDRVLEDGAQVSVLLARLRVGPGGAILLWQHSVVAEGRASAEGMSLLFDALYGPDPLPGIRALYLLLSTLEYGDGAELVRSLFAAEVAEAAGWWAASGSPRFTVVAREVLDRWPELGALLALLGLGAIEGPAAPEDLAERLARSSADPVVVAPPEAELPLDPISPEEGEAAPLSEVPELIPPEAEVPGTSEPETNRRLAIGMVLLAALAGAGLLWRGTGPPPPAPEVEPAPRESAVVVTTPPPVVVPPEAPPVRVTAKEVPATPRPKHKGDGTGGTEVAPVAVENGAPEVSLEDKSSWPNDPGPTFKAKVTGGVCPDLRLRLQVNKKWEEVHFLSATGMRGCDFVENGKSNCANTAGNFLQRSTPGPVKFEWICCSSETEPASDCKPRNGVRSIEMFDPQAKEVREE